MSYIILIFMKKIAAAKFKEQCLALLDRLSSEGLIITKHGKPVARIIPIQVEGAHLIGSLKGKLTIRSKNIFSTGLKWNAQS